MGWVYLDDKFPDHPKVGEAGGDAGWLFVCGLAYCNRMATGGRIPKKVVPQLSDRKKPSVLAATLVKVNLWEDDDTHYVIHGYDRWQRTSVAAHEARVAKAEKAARVRWEKERAAREKEAKEQPKPDAQSNAQALLDKYSDDAQPMPYACAALALTQVVTSVDTSSSVEGASDDDDRPPFVEERLWRIWAERDRDRLVAETGRHPHDDDAWIAKVAQKRRSKHFDEVAKLRHDRPDLDLIQLIDAVEGRHQPTKSRNPLDATQAAATALRERPDCPTCGPKSPGWVIPDGSSDAQPCPDCHAHASAS